MALLGNVPTFFYFGITLLPLKKKVLQTSRQFNARLVFKSIGGKANGKLTEGVFQQQQQLFAGNKGEDYQNTYNTRQKETTGNESENPLRSEDPKQSLFLSFLSIYF